MYEYIRFSSRNAPADGQSLYTINLPKTIQNATSCHVKSFSMPNTAFNVTTKNNSFEWYETIGNNTNPPPILQATIPAKFYTIEDLITTIATEMTTVSQSTKASGDTLASLTFTMSQIPSTTTVDTFHIELTGTIDAGGTNTAQKKFCPKVYKGSIWTMLGFAETFRVEPTHHGRVNPVLEPNLILNPITTRGDGRFKSITATTTGSNATKTAAFSPRDSHECYHITSSLADAVYEVEADGVSRHTNYLLTVPNSSNRYSWIHYLPTEPVFHNLHGVNLNQFTIGLADEDGLLMNNEEHQEFSVVLAIEYEPQHKPLNSGQQQTLMWRKSHC